MHENVLRAQIQDTGSATEIIRRTSHGWASWASEQPLARMVQSATKLRARSILDPVGEKKMKSYLVRVGHLCSPGIKRNLSSNSAYRWRICEDKRPHNFLCLNQLSSSNFIQSIIGAPLPCKHLDSLPSGYYCRQYVA
jgi:hypothetical protein